MKRIPVIILLLTIVTSCYLNAQLFTGGSIGFNSSGGKQDYGTGEQDKTSYMNLDFSPAIGYFLSENLAAGVKIQLSLDKTTTPPFTAGGDETVDTETEIGFVPFIRYYAARFNKLSVFGQVQAGITMGTEKTKTGSTETDGPKTTTIMFNVLPAVALEVSDHLMLEAYINLFRFGFSSETEKNGDNKETTNNFNFGLSSSNIFTTGSISVGAIYLF